MAAIMTAEQRAAYNARKAKWRADNPAKVKAIKAKFRAQPDRVEIERAGHREWLKKNAESVAAYKAAYRSNPEKKEIERRQRAAYREKNKEFISEIKRNARAVKRNAIGSHTRHDVERLMGLQKGRCACCRDDLTVTGRHVDHVIPLAAGGSNNPDNIQLLCPTCNMQKNTKHPIDFMQSKGFLL